VSTATLAWGVNLPAHAVVIRGTDIYDAKRGQFVDVGILDVQQIFGRAGRPQFDVSGHGIIITTHDKMYHYVKMLMRQTPIESQFINRLDDNLNAEIVLGTVTNVQEAVRWLDFTYFMIRAKLNPLAYGIGWSVRQDDPELQQYRIELLERVAINLDRREMIRFNMTRGTFQSTDTGRLASHYYISANTIEMFLHGDEQCELKEHMQLAECLALVSHSSEFAQLKVREEEMEELEDIAARVMQPIKGGLANVQGKVRQFL
jgi:activating signal cointegrator complex subunit 3